MMVDIKSKIFHIIFAFMGLAPVGVNEAGSSIERKQKEIFNTILYWLPALSFIIVNLFAVILQWMSFPDNLILNVYLLIVASSNIVANIQCLLYNREYFDVIRSVNDIKSLQCTKDEDFKKFVNSYQIKFVTICLILITKAILSYSIPYSEGQGYFERLLATVTFILESISSMACLHAIYFIDYTQIFIKELNRTLIQTKPYFETAGVKVKKLLRIKCVHLKIWNLLQQINTFFSWSFVSISIKYLVDITYDIYRLYLEFEQKGWRNVSHLDTILYLLNSLISLVFLINSCEYCSSETTNLVQSVVKYSSSSRDNSNLYYVKQDTIAQIRDLPFQILGAGFFKIDRNYLAAIVAGIASYIVIFIQFYSASSAPNAVECNCACN